MTDMQSNGDIWHQSVTMPQDRFSLLTAIGYEFIEELIRALAATEIHLQN